MLRSHLSDLGYRTPAYDLGAVFLRQACEGHAECVRYFRILHLAPHPSPLTFRRPQVARGARRPPSVVPGGATGESARQLSSGVPGGRSIGVELGLAHPESADNGSSPQPYLALSARGSAARFAILIDAPPVTSDRADAG
jgi:hypothetical protein